MSSDAGQIEEKLSDPASDVRRSVVQDVAGRFDTESRRVQWRLLLDRDRAVIESMANALIVMADVESVALVSDAMYLNDDDEGVWQTLAWSLKQALDDGRFDVAAVLRDVVDRTSGARREGALDALDWLGLLTREERDTHPAFTGGYTLVLEGERREMRMVDASSAPAVEFGDPPYLVAHPFSLTAPERGNVSLVDTALPARDDMDHRESSDVWTLGSVSVTSGDRGELISRNNEYRIAGRPEVEAREVDWAFRSEWRVQVADSGERMLECCETFVHPERSSIDGERRLVERVEILRRDRSATTVVSSESRPLGSDPLADHRLPVRMRKSGELSGVLEPPSPLSE